MEDSFDPFTDPETLQLARRFEQMLKDDQHYFFDLDEFEELIDYYLFSNEISKAESCIAVAMDQYPTETGLLLKKVQLLISTDKNEKALKILSALEENNYDDYEIHLAKGSLYSQLDRSEKAIEEYTLALHDSDDLDEILSNIAFEYENLGKYEKAIEFLTQATEQNPDNDAALYELSFCFEISQQTEKAITFLTNYLSKRPFSKAGWFNLGIAYSNLELFEKAIDAYDYSIAIDETFASAYFNKANCYANLNNYSGAIETYLETSFYEDPEPLTFYYIAECYEKMEKYDSAIQYYTKAIDLDPEFGDAWLGAGVAYDASDNPKVALTYVEHAIKIAPTIPDYWFLLGDIQIKLEQTEEAIASYRKVIELEPDQPEIWLELSYVYARRWNYEKALEILKEGMKWHDQNPDFLYASSIYLLKSGKTKQACELLEKALAMDYDGHRKIFNAYPDLRNNQTITEIIEGYRDKNKVTLRDTWLLCELNLSEKLHTMENIQLPLMPERTKKPRNNGVVMVMDKGLSIREAEDFISVCGDLTDFVKLGFGTSVVTPRVKEKIKLYQKANIKVYLGGTLFEAFLIRGMEDEYKKFIDGLGIDTIEISDGSMKIEHAKKCEVIHRYSKDYTVLSEVGSKEAGILIAPARWTEMMETELASGAFMVIAEARESGTAGIYRPSGKAHTLLINMILSKIAIERILWEAPLKSQQIWFIKHFGANVNLGNIPPAEVIPLETLRLGLRGDTFFNFLPPKYKKYKLE